LGGYVFMTLWGWFIFSVFSLPLLTFPQAMGIKLVVSGLGLSAEPKKDATLEGLLGDILLLSFLAPTILLGLGWIVQRFV